MPVGPFGGGRADRIDDDDAGSLTARLLDVGPAVGIGDDRIGAPDNDVAAFLDVLRKDAITRTHRGGKPGVRGRAADIALQPGRPETREKASIERLRLHQPFRPHEAVREDCGRPVLLDDFFQARGDIV